MLNENTATTEYFRTYRQQIGFTNQNGVKDFFGAKDVTPTIDFSYLQLLNTRLYSIVDKINTTVSLQIKLDDLDAFKKMYIDRPFEIMRDSGILPSLNNQGRRPEQVYFSWMRGYIISNYFLSALEFVFMSTYQTSNLSATMTYLKKTPLTEHQRRIWKSDLKMA